MAQVMAMAPTLEAPSASRAEGHAETLGEALDRRPNHF